MGFYGVFRKRWLELKSERYINDAKLSPLEHWSYAQYLLEAFKARKLSFFDLKV